MSGRSQVRDYYATQDIVPRLLAALRVVQGEDAPVTPDTLAVVGVLLVRLARQLCPLFGCGLCHSEDRHGREAAMTETGSKRAGC